MEVLPCLLNSCDHWSYPAQSVILGISSIRKSAVVYKAKESQDVHETIPTDPVSNRRIVKDLVPPPVVSKSGQNIYSHEKGEPEISPYVYALLLLSTWYSLIPPVPDLHKYLSGL